MSDTFQIRRSTSNPGKPAGCIDLCHSKDDGGWYAMEYDFERADNATRVSKDIFLSRDLLVSSLLSGRHRWEDWD